MKRRWPLPGEQEQDLAASRVELQCAGDSLQSIV